MRTRADTEPHWKNVMIDGCAMQEVKKTKTNHEEDEKNDIYHTAHAYASPLHSQGSVEL